MPNVLVCLWEQHHALVQSLCSPGQMVFGLLVPQVMLLLSPGLVPMQLRSMLPIRTTEILLLCSLAEVIMFPSSTNHNSRTEKCVLSISQSLSIQHVLADCLA